MPQTSKWPMASGFGGIIGDLILGTFTLFFQHANWARGLFGFISFFAFLTCSYFAFNLNARDLDGAWDQATYYYSSLRVWIDGFGKTKKKMGSKIKVASKPIQEPAPKIVQNFEEKTIPSKKINIGIELPKKAKSSPRVNDELQPELPWERPEGFELPRLEFLKKPPQRNIQHDEAALRQNALLLMSVLNQFKVQGEIINVRPGPVVTLYELEPEAGIKSSRVIGLADDIARSMAAVSCRVAVVKGRNAIGIELPNSRRESVYLRTLLSSREFENGGFDLPLALGETIGGEPSIVDLSKMPHLLIAGTTGSGKSVGINAMILSLLYRLTPDQCRFIMIDPKMVELSIYNDIPHLLAPVVIDPKKAVSALKWTVREMENRYKLMSKVGVRNITGFNERAREAQRKGETFEHIERTGWNRETGEPIFESRQLELKPMPFIVVVIDEMADLMMIAGKEIEGAVQRLAQMARAVGIHLITATQRPSVDVITGTIKANFPTRISYMVTTKIDSRTILGEGGAEQLLGQGDLLFMANGGRISRLHGPFVSDDEVRQIVAALKAQGSPQYFEDITSHIDEESDSDNGMNGAFGANSGDELFDKAVNIVSQTRKVSTSFLQRQLKLGYNRAADLVDRMEREGMISAPDHVGRRQVLLPEHRDY
ncbi:MAG: cell division protein FtsK [Caulobacterales bacterium]|nr:cell division protein FtsK [Caulobacterales bacterium]